MAASIKMDELLVSWLGTDNVYENVLSLIEKKRTEVTKPKGGNAAADPAAADGAEDAAAAAAGKDGEESADGANSTESPRGVIPPFYRRPPPAESSAALAAAIPAGGAAEGGGTRHAYHAQPLPRRRSDSFADDQTWDGTGGGGSSSAGGAVTVKGLSTAGGGAADDNDGNGVVPPPPPPPPPTSPTSPSPSSPTDGSEGGSGSGSGAAGAGGAAGGAGEGAQEEAPLPCIRDQVKSIYAELGKDPPPSSQSSRPHRYPPSDGGGGEDDDESSAELDGRYLTADDFVRVTKEVCQFPTFFNGPLYGRILELWNAEHSGGASSGGAATDSAAAAADGGTAAGAADDDDAMDVVTFGMFRWYWRREMECHDASERFFRLLKRPDRDFVGRDDFLPYIKELLKDHPGLEFLSNHAEFQEKYAVTVITRIFYSVNTCHSGRITLRQIRRSDLLSAFQQVDEEEDINKVTRYFSYEHFYVLYCRFWELDHDRDYRITREDLLKYGDHCLSHMIVDRIFDAAPRPFEESGPGPASASGASASNASNPTSPASAADSSAGGDSQSQQQQSRGTNREYLSYEDFIFFMLSEEDKANEISVRYWFSCIDVDGDGRLNNMEMRSFYAVQLHRMQCMGHEIVPFEDMLCQMIDMIKPASDDYLVVEDFLQTECAQVSGALFDALFNLNKYLQFEQRDPFMERQKREDEFETDWDRFACIDYNRLAMEEEAREEEAMEIDWVTVDDEDDDGEDFNSLGLSSASEAPF